MLIYLQLLSSLSIILLFFGLSSCNKEAISPINEEAISPSLNLLDIESSIQLLTTCDIIGNSCVNSGSTATYTYSSGFTQNDVNWSIQSGNISINSGQGTNNITLEFGSGFNGGSIFAIGSGSGGIVCSTTLTISECGVGNSCGNFGTREPYVWSGGCEDFLDSPTFSVRTINSGSETIQWAISNQTPGSNLDIVGSSNQKNVRVARVGINQLPGNPNDSFTISCTVTRTCESGVVYTKTISETGNLLEFCNY